MWFGWTTEEREQLHELVAKGKTAAYRIRHAHILSAVDADGPNWTDAQAAQAFRCHANAAVNVRRRLVEGGLDAALERKKQDRPFRPRVLGDWLQWLKSVPVRPAKQS